MNRTIASIDKSSSKFIDKKLVKQLETINKSIDII